MTRWSLILFFAFVGCDSPPTYHQDIAPLLNGRCVSCHQAGGIGPFVLDSYEAAAPLAAMIAGSVASRRMPPWGAAAGHRAYLDDPSLSDAQIALFQAWADADAPKGDAQEPAEPLAIVGSGLSRSDLELKMVEAYAPTKFPDDYRCFVLDWPEQALTHVTGFAAHPGNQKIVHHIAVYLVGPDTPLGEGAFDKLRAFDAHDEGPGYTCYGGPSGHEDLGIPIQQVAQWVPGASGWDFPEGTGIAVQPGSKLVLQLHYNTANPNPQPDQTSIAFRLEPQVERRAAFAPWLDLSWVLGQMNIPAGEPDVIHSIQDDPRSFFDFLGGGVDVSEGFRVHAVLLHMHKRGHAGQVTIVRADGGEEILLEEPRYDFNWQQIYRFAQPIDFSPGDELALTCRWDNTASNQAPGVEPIDLSWGEGSGQEMCVANLYISEHQP